jgi:prevent-host-death family protein
MAIGPFVVRVTDLRRRLADLIDQVARGEHPLFITQHGFVTAVLISREQYRAWCPDGTPCTPVSRRGDERELAPRRGAHPRPGSSVRPVRRVWTQYGWLEFDLAQVLAEQGVQTELVWTEEGWWTDDEG